MSKNENQTKWNLWMIEVFSVFINMLIFLVLPITIFHTILRKIIPRTARAEIMRHTKTTETRVTGTVLDKVRLMRYKDFDGFQPILPRIRLRQANFYQSRRIRSVSTSHIKMKSKKWSIFRLTMVKPKNFRDKIFYDSFEAPWRDESIDVTIMTIGGHFDHGLVISSDQIWPIFWL